MTTVRRISCILLGLCCFVLLFILTTNIYLLRPSSGLGRFTSAFLVHLQREDYSTEARQSLKLESVQHRNLQPKDNSAKARQTLKPESVLHRNLQPKDNSVKARQKLKRGNVTAELAETAGVHKDGRHSPDTVKTKRQHDGKDTALSDEATTRVKKETVPREKTQTNTKLQPGHETRPNISEENSNENQSYGKSNSSSAILRQENKQKLTHSKRPEEQNKPSLKVETQPIQDNKLSFTNATKSLQDNKHALTNATKLVQDSKYTLKNATKFVQDNKYTLTNATESVQDNKYTLTNATKSVQDNKHALTNATESVQDNKYTLTNATESVQDNKYTLTNATESVQDNKYTLTNATESVQGNKYTLTNATESVQGNKYTLTNARKSVEDIKHSFTNATKSIGGSNHSLFLSGRNESHRGRQKYLIYLCDRRSPCGGWADRQRGMVSAYLLALLTGRRFGINMSTPCDVRRFYQPHHVDWDVTEGELRNRSVRYINSMDGRGPFNGDLLRRDVNQAYPEDVLFLRTNVEHFWPLRGNARYKRSLPEWTRHGRPVFFREGWRRLMKPTPHLQSHLQAFLRHCHHGNRTKPFVCAHVRVGVSKYNPHDTEKRTDVTKLGALWDFLQAYVSNGSDVFLATDNPDVRAMSRKKFGSAHHDTGGLIMHVDLTRGGSDGQRACLGLEYALLDQLLLTTCDVLVTSPSGFSARAALIRGTTE